MQSEVFLSVTVDLEVILSKLTGWVEATFAEAEAFDTGIQTP